MTHDQLPQVPCKSCGAPMVWATTVAGKRMPLSVQSAERRFTIAKDADGNPVALEEVTYLTHFADCPDADAHRRPR